MVRLSSLLFLLDHSASSAFIPPFYFTPNNYFNAIVLFVTGKFVTNCGWPTWLFIVDVITTHCCLHRQLEGGHFCEQCPYEMVCKVLSSTPMIHLNILKFRHPWPYCSYTSNQHEKQKVCCTMCDKKLEYIWYVRTHVYGSWSFGSIHPHVLTNNLWVSVCYTRNGVYTGHLTEDLSLHCCTD